MVHLAVDPPAKPMCFPLPYLTIDDTDQGLVAGVGQLVGIHATVLDDAPDACQEVAHLGGIGIEVLLILHVMYPQQFLMIISVIDRSYHYLEIHVNIRRLYRLNSLDGVQTTGPVINFYLIYQRRKWVSHLGELIQTAASIHPCLLHAVNIFSFLSVFI